MSNDFNVKDTVTKVLKTSDSPLKFFMIVIFVLGGVAYALIAKSILPADLTEKLTIGVFILIIIVLILVTVLLIFYPKKLTFDKEAHMAAMREKLGDSELPYPYDDTDLSPNVTAPKFLKN